MKKNEVIITLLYLFSYLTSCIIIIGGIVSFAFNEIGYYSIIKLIANLIIGITFLLIAIFCHIIYNKKE